MKHVLLIANLDGKSVPLLRYASRMCKALDLRLHVLQIDPENTPVLISSPYYVNKFGLLGTATDYGRKNDIKTFVKNNTDDLIDSSWISLDIFHGNIDDSLGKFMNEKKIDLVITRRRALFETQYGENELYRKLLLNMSMVPILVLSENQTYKKWDKLTYLTTCSQHDFDNIKWLHANLSGSAIKSVHCSPKVVEKDSKRWVSYLQNEISDKIEFEESENSVSKFVSEFEGTSTDSDMLCLTTKKRTFWDRLMNPSLTMELVKQTQNQVLIFKHSNS